MEEVPVGVEGVGTEEDEKVPEAVNDEEKHEKDGGAVCCCDEVTSEYSLDDCSHNCVHHTRIGRHDAAAGGCFFHCEILLNNL